MLEFKQDSLGTGVNNRINLLSWLTFATLVTLTSTVLSAINTNRKLNYLCKGGFEELEKRINSHINSKFTLLQNILKKEFQVFKVKQNQYSEKALEKDKKEHGKNSDQDSIARIFQIQPSAPESPKSSPKTTYNKQNNLFGVDAIIAKYNEENGSVENLKIATVTETKESQQDRYVGKSHHLILHENNKGNYWILEKDSELYVVPKAGANFNSHNLKLLSDLYEFENSADNSHGFDLITLATVSQIGNNFKLEEPGKLKFRKSVEHK